MSSTLFVVSSYEDILKSLDNFVMGKDLRYQSRSVTQLAEGIIAGRKTQCFNLVALLL